MVSTAMVVGAMASWTANDVKNIATFKTARAAIIAADAATQTAIWGIRFQYQSFPSWTSCGSTTDPFEPPGVPSIDNWRIDVFCVNPPGTSGGGTRVVTVNAYLPSAVCGSTPCSGAAPLVSAQVTFNDYSGPPANAMDCAPSKAQTTCGTGMSVNSWVVRPG
jgi:hypothetical protein